MMAESAHVLRARHPARCHLEWRQKDPCVSDVSHAFRWQRQQLELAAIAPRCFDLTG